jgi:hypothetical protein
VQSREVGVRRIIKVEIERVAEIARTTMMDWPIELQLPEPQDDAHNEDAYRSQSYYRDSDFGLSLVHIFVSDLIGRDTVADMIFKRQTDADFRPIRISG